MNNNLKTTFALALVLLSIATTMSRSMAASLPGAEDPAFVAAVETWLNDDDAESLPLLARLAREGNVAARLFLSRIEITDRAPTEFVARMSRTERLTLFRSGQGSGVFRSSWIKVEAASGNPIAKILMAGNSLGINIPAISRLFAIGEIEASEHLIRKVAVDGSEHERRELAQILPPESELSPYLRGFRDARSGMTTGRTALQTMIGLQANVDPKSIELDRRADTSTAANYVDFGYQAGAQAIGDWTDNRYTAAIANWTLRAPQSVAVARLCQRACKEQQVAACAMTSFGLVGGYYEMIRFDSPLESVVPQSLFVDSERALGMAARKIANARTEAGVSVFSDHELRQKSSCLQAAIASLNH